MLKSRFSHTLLASAAFVSVPVYAQDTGPISPSPPVSGAETAQGDAEDGIDSVAQPGIEAGDDQSEDTQVSTAGAGSFEDGDIVVQGRYIPEPVRNTAQVVNVLSTEEIARTGDGDIASALGRVTGLSVNTNGFVYVRGLGDRYSAALLNGLPLPSTDPLRRQVPLDIFPSSVVSSALVQKSYSANYSGEFGGGVINLTTPTLPEENFLTISGSIAGNSETTGQLGYTYYGSDGDIVGYDFGARDIPDELRNVLDAGIPIQNITDGSGNPDLALQNRVARSFNNSNTVLLQRNGDIPANFSADIEAGYSFYAGDTRLGLFGSAGFSNGWTTRDALRQEADSNTPTDGARSVRTENRVTVNGLLGLGAELPDGDEVRLTALYIHDTSKIARKTEAYDVEANASNTNDPFKPSRRPDFIRQDTSFFERQILDLQAIGEFEVRDFTINVRGGYANSKRDAPYERFLEYAYDGGIDRYVNPLATCGNGCATIAFSELDEDLWTGSIDVGYELPTSFVATVSAGYAYYDASRYSSRREFAFRDSAYVDPQLASQGIDSTDTDVSRNGFGQLTPDYLLSNGSIFYNGIVLSENGTTAGQQAYEADLTTHGFYLKSEFEPIDLVRVDLGVRYETAEQNVRPLDLFNSGLLPIAPLKNDYFLPAATITWNFAPDFQLRLHGSKTIARPQFRELAPQRFVDIDTDRIFFGNPFLSDTEFKNAEARVEYYFGEGERATAALFYKDIDNPVETIGNIATGSRTLQGNFANAPGAEIYGAEVEVLKYIPLYDVADWLSTKRIVLSANYTYSDSKLKVGDNDQVSLYQSSNLGPLLLPATNLFEDGSRLVGQSNHLVNVQFGIEDTEKTQQLTLLARYASDRITLRGPLTSGTRDPDVIEEPGLEVDIVARDTWNISGRDFDVKFAARNIFGEEYKETQTFDDFTAARNVYDRGTSFSFSVGTTF